MGVFRLATLALITAPRLPRMSIDTTGQQIDVSLQRGLRLASVVRFRECSRSCSLATITSLAVWDLEVEGREVMLLVSLVVVMLLKIWRFPKADPASCARSAHLRITPGFAVTSSVFVRAGSLPIEVRPGFRTFIVES